MSSLGRRLPPTPGSCSRTYRRTGSTTFEEAVESGFRVARGVELSAGYVEHFRRPERETFVAGPFVHDAFGDLGTAFKPFYRIEERAVPAGPKRGVASRARRTDDD